MKVEQDYDAIYLAPPCFDERQWCAHGSPEDCYCDDGPHPWVKFTRTPSRTEADVVAETEARIVAWLRDCAATGAVYPDDHILEQAADAIQAGAYRKQESKNG